MGKKINARYKKGLTLVEVIVSLALLTVILSIAVSLLTTGQKMFKKGASRADIQHDIRMAADFITSELRNVTTIGFGERPDESFSWIGISGKTLQHKAAGNEEPVVKTGEYIIGVSFNFSEPVVLDGEQRQVFEFALEGEEHTSITSKILLNNIENEPANPSSLNQIYYRKPVGGNDVWSVANAINGFRQPVTSNTIKMPTVPQGYSIVLESTSDTSIIDINGNVTFPLGVEDYVPVELTFRVTKGSDSAVANVTVFVQVLNPKSVAESIKSIPPISDGDLMLVLPDVPDGFGCVIKSSSDEDVIALDGTITRQDEDVSVILVLTITKDGYLPWDTGEITVIVPAGSGTVDLSGVTYNVAEGAIMGTTGEMQYNISGDADTPAGTWKAAGEGITSGVEFVPGSVWVRESGNPSNVVKAGIIHERAAAPVVSVTDPQSNKARFMKSANGTGLRVTASDNYEFKLNNDSWVLIEDDTTVKTNGKNTLLVRIRATATELPSQETDDLDYDP